MDNLVLIRVAAQLARGLSDAVVQELVEEAPWRFRLRLTRGEERRAVLISLDPRLPWLGRPGGRWRLPRRSPSSFTATVSRRLHGAVVAEVTKPHAERRVTFRMADGRALVAELFPHAANLVLLDAAGRVEATARRPARTQRERLAVERSYRPMPSPPGRIDPFGASVEEIRRRLVELRCEGLTPSEALVRGFQGVGAAAAELLTAEAGSEDLDLAELVAKRTAQLAAGEHDPVIEGVDDPAEEVFETDRCRLLPWPPPGSGSRSRLDDPAWTAGLFHDALERERAERRRAEALLGILGREARRMREVEAKVAADLASFEDPERYRRWAEALLAGLNEARRVGDHVIVPDPYDPERAPLPVPVAPGRSPTSAAERLFARHRRAKRGLERARQREEEVHARRVRLERLRDAQRGTIDSEGITALEHAMQREGIPVGIQAPGRAARDAGRVGVPRIEGVRLFTSSDGDAVLVGKSGRDNNRLTFKLAGPEDFWLHALGVPGAHVIVRNEGRRSRPSEATLTEAAETAAWFSEARRQPNIDVQWTRRKYVRRLRGAPPGTVTVKRSETVRVRPRCPPQLSGGSG